MSARLVGALSGHVERPARPATVMGRSVHSPLQAPPAFLSWLQQFLSRLLCPPGQPDVPTL
eukprot:8944591-Pyramimonas_sp.AAC.1